MSQQINLYNPLLRKQKKYFSALTMAQALGLIVLGILAFSGYARYQVKLMNGEAERSAAMLASQQAVMNRLSAEMAARKPGRQLEQEVAQAERQIRARRKVLEMLQGGDFGNTTGFAEYLRAFSRQMVGGLWLTGFDIQGQDMSLSGRTLQAELVPAYIGRLKQEPVLQGKTFAVLEMKLPSADAGKGGDDKTRAQAARYVEFSLHSSVVEKAETGGQAR